MVERFKDKIADKLGMAKPAVSTGELEVRKSAGKVPGSSASAAETRAAAVRAPISGIAARYLDRIMSSGLSDDETPDEVPGFEQPVTTTLPAVISKAIEVTGGAINPKWHAVKHLPGHMQSAIRAMGRAVFAPITKTRIEDIFVLSTFTNRPQELDYVGSWIKKHGVRVDTITYKFEQLLPGYGAEIHVYSVEGYTFAVIQDPMGKYIYGWPDSDNKIGPTRISQRKYG